MSLTTFPRLHRRPRPMVAPASSPFHREHVYRRYRGWAIALGVTVVFLVFVHLIGSPIARHVINRKLAQEPGFIGRVEDVRLALWRAGMEVNDFALYVRGHVSDGPMLHIKKATVSFAPSALILGKLGGRVLVDGAELNFIKREDQPDTPEKKQERAAKVAKAKQQVHHWQDALEHTLPMKLTRLEARNVRIHFLDRTEQPNAEFAVERLHVVATDLQNRPKANGDPLPAKIQIDGVTTGQGQLHAAVQVDPLARQPRFKASFELRDMNLPDANSFLLAYANADVSRGKFEVYMETKAEGGGYNGYVKPLFHDLDFRNAEDRDKNAAQRFAEKVVSTVTSALKNEDKEQVATKAPFSGNFADNDVDIWTTIAQLFRNAFVQALRGGFENQTPSG